MSDTSLELSKVSAIVINGAAIAERIRGPTKDRGTTPGNSKWSY